MAESIGREHARTYASAAFPDGYYEFEPGEIEELSVELRERLSEVNAQERIYDREAVAFHDGNSPLRQEPVMLHSWKGILHGNVEINLAAPQRDFDTVGLKIIIRGTGVIQEAVRAVLSDLEPDSTSTEECEIYSVGYQSVGSEPW